jgi:general secretion pathway protein D
MALILQRVLGMDSGSSERTAESNVITPAPTSDASSPSDFDATAPTPSLLSTGHSENSQSARGPRVIASDETNSLLIYADGEEYEFIRDALTRLDNPVPQVLIEAILAEVTLTDELQYGVNFRALSGDFSGTNSSTTSATPAPILPGFAISWVGSSASAILNSLQSRTNVRVVSAPKLVVLNNQTATLQVGDQVPIVTQQLQSTAAAGAPIVNTVELRDTGVILRVTPRVNESGTVTLDISQEVSDVARTTTSGINSPTIRQRRISSVVATRSGEMVALGGLIRDRTESGRSGIPLISQIPVIGGLFGNHSRTGSRTELIVLLTPTVIRAPQDAQAIVGQLIDALDIAGPMVENARDRQVGGHVPPQ